MTDSKREIHRRYREKHREEINARHREWSANHSQEIWAASLRRRHGMLPEQWFAMWDAQMGRCYLCQEPMDGSRPRSIAIDHDWRCCQEKRSCATCRRGLAHNPCNRWLGQMKDNPALIRRFAENAEAAVAAVSARLAAKAVQAELPVNVAPLGRKKESA